MSVNFTPYRKELFLTQHGKKTLATGFNGAPALFEIRSQIGEIDDEIIEFWAHIIESYNNKCREKASDNNG